MEKLCKKCNRFIEGENKKMSIQKTYICDICKEKFEQTNVYGIYFQEKNNFTLYCSIRNVMKFLECQRHICFHCYEQIKKGSIN